MQVHDHTAELRRPFLLSGGTAPDHRTPLILVPTTLCTPLTPACSPSKLPVPGLMTSCCCALTAGHEVRHVDYEAGEGDGSAEESLIGSTRRRSVAHLGCLAVTVLEALREAIDESAALLGGGGGGGKRRRSSPRYMGTQPAAGLGQRRRR